MSKVIERLQRIAEMRKLVPDPLDAARPALKVVGGREAYTDSTLPTTAPRRVARLVPLRRKP
ncbi:MAG: hypothetical protein D6679_02290 [Candidatus Hydrogenedentota bacterium]|nr:MAG: hypothetical protein D6679_02290 [Candidatus Hydrogenedentota bacterium]